jgi:hypothetical protein
VVEGER